MDGTNGGEEWQSKSGGRRNGSPELSVETAHRALFERVEASISFGFASIQRALVDLQLQLQIKLRQILELQILLLSTQAPADDAISQFFENMKKIDRALESFTAHADNLSHIKLSLARAAAFVSPEGNVAQLVAPRYHQLPVGLAQSRIGTDHLVYTDTPTSDYNTRSQHTSSVLESKLDGCHLFDTNAITQANRIPNSTCFVFYLPPSATNATLHQLFGRFGTILNAYVAMDKTTNRTRGFGFVDFSTPAEANAAVKALDKYPYDGKFLSVSIKV